MQYVEIKDYFDWRHYFSFYHTPKRKEEPMKRVNQAIPENK